MFSLDKGTGLYHNFAMRLAVPFLVVLLAALSAAADGFVYTPVEPSPERRAEMEAMCARLEERGFPRIPPNAEWTCAYYESFSDLDNELYFGEEDSCSSGMAWLVNPNGKNGTNTLVGVSGCLFQCPSNDYSRGRIALDVSLFIRRLREIKEANDAPDADGARPSLGLGILFAVGMFRSGREAEADAIVRAVEGERGLAVAEREARLALARSDMIEAGYTFEKSGDFNALADTLAKSLERNPPDGDAVSALDTRKAKLDAIRAHLAGAIPDIPGLNKEGQCLARALPDWTDWSFLDRDSLFPSLDIDTVPWLLPGAWTNAMPFCDAVHSDAALRIARLGIKAVPLLEAMTDDSSPARWKRNRWGEKDIFVTRGDVARELLSRFLPFEIGRVALESSQVKPMRDFTANFTTGTEDDLLRLYVQGGRYSEDESPLLWAYLARRLALAPFPILESDILMALHERTVYDADRNVNTAVLAGDTALLLADLYLSVRGEAAAGFRDKLCAQLRQIASSFSFPTNQTAKILNGGCEFVCYTARNPQGFVESIRAWTGKVADNYAALRLREGTSDEIRARADAVANWYARLWNAKLAKKSEDDISTPAFVIFHGIEESDERPWSDFVRPAKGFRDFHEYTAAQFFTSEEIKQMERWTREWQAEYGDKEPDDVE